MRVCACSRARLSRVCRTSDCKTERCFSARVWFIEHEPPHRTGPARFASVVVGFSVFCGRSECVCVSVCVRQPHQEDPTRVPGSANPAHIRSGIDKLFLFIVIYCAYYFDLPAVREFCCIHVNYFQLNYAHLRVQAFKWVRASASACERVCVLLVLCVFEDAD